MKISIQIDYLRNRFNNKNIIDKSNKAKMNHQQVKEIHSFINNANFDNTKVIDDDFTVELKDGFVYIKDTE